MDSPCFEMKSVKTLIAGIAMFTVLSTPFYAFGGTKEDVSELKDIIPKILKSYQITYKSFEAEKHLYRVDASIDNDFEFEVHSKEKRKIYKFEDAGADGTLDVYIGSDSFKFTPQNTPPEKWKKLEEKFSWHVGKILPLAKKILKERSSSLDTDLEDM